MKEKGKEKETNEPKTLTLTNDEICAAMTAPDDEYSYSEYVIESASGEWKVNASRCGANTFLQCRGRKGSYIKTPLFERDIKSVTLYFAEGKYGYSNLYCAFPSAWVASSEDAAYSEDGNVGKAESVANEPSVIIPIEAGNKQVCVYYRYIRILSRSHRR